MVEGSGLEKKSENLQEIILNMESVVVAFSGGIDSTFLLNTAKKLLGERVIAFTVISPLISKSSAMQLKEMVEMLGVKHIVKEINPLENEEFAENPPDRCYICKRMIFQEALRIADENGFEYIIDGTNFEDLSLHRPGLRALMELGVVSPLAEVELSKDEIRTLARAAGLPNWNAPPDSCLITRFPYRVKITSGMLRRVEIGEKFLRDLGFQTVRLRDYGELARVEVMEGEIARFMEDDVRVKVLDRLKDIGYSHITLDLTGFRSGST